MAAVPEGHEAAGIRINQGDLSQHLEGVCAGLLRVGVDAVRDFQAVDIGVVLHLAADGVEQWRGEEPENTEDQENHGQRGPVAQFADLPARGETPHHPTGDAVNQVERQEREDCDQNQPVDDVVENVVTHLMAEDKERFRRGGLLDGGVPHHHALGGPEAGYVGIQLVGFLAGLHQEHTLAGDGKTAALRDFFNRLHQLRIALLQRFKLVEERIYNQRGNNEEQHLDRLQDQPEIKPPAPRALADDEDHEPQQRNTKYRGDEQPLGSVAEPGSPSLHGEAVLQADALLVSVQREVQQLSCK